MNRGCVILNKLDKKIYKKGKDLKVLSVSLPNNGITQLCIADFLEAVYLYTFKVEYEDEMGNIKEIYSEPYMMPKLNNALNFFSSQWEIDQVLNELQFEVKSYEGQVKAYISTTKENIKKYKKARDMYIDRKRNLITKSEISMNEELNDYILRYLNSFFEKSNVKITLNQNDFVENKVRYEMATGYNYNLKELYSVNEIINSISNDEFCESQLSVLYRNLAIDVREDKEITIHISNYSKDYNMEGLTIVVYCQID